MKRTTTWTCNCGRWQYHTSAGKWLGCSHARVDEGTMDTTEACWREGPDGAWIPICLACGEELPADPWEQAVLEKKPRAEACRTHPTPVHDERGWAIIVENRPLAYGSTRSEAWQQAWGVIEHDAR